MLVVAGFVLEVTKVQVELLETLVDVSEAGFALEQLKLDDRDTFRWSTISNRAAGTHSYINCSFPTEMQVKYSSTPTTIVFLGLQQEGSSQNNMNCEFLSNLSC